MPLEKAVEFDKLDSLRGWRYSGVRDVQKRAENWREMWDDGRGEKSW